MNSQMQPMVKTIVDFIDRIGSDVNMRRDRPYTGQPHTDTGIRGSQEISGITMRDLRDAFIRAYIISHPCYIEGTLQPLQPNYTLSEECKKGPDACLCENDVYDLKGDVDPIAVSQNLACEIEKLMGIFPNIPGFTKGDHKHESERIDKNAPIDLTGIPIIDL